MKIVIKVGTQSILSKEGAPQHHVMQSLVNQIVHLQYQGHQVVFVSSGAVGFGRAIARQSLGKEYGVSIGEKQLLASLGQHELIHLYTKMFQYHNVLTSQILLTKKDFYTRDHYLNIARLLREIITQKNIIPIINENDSVAVEELMFTDNDELAGLMATLINADKLIILSNVEGVYSGHPDDPEAKLISVINPEEEWPTVSSVKSAHGRGGMVTKLSNASKMSKLGITTHIASINSSITDIVYGKSVGTKILASSQKSNIKKWMAYSTPSAKIKINHCLYEILKENKRVISILPIGIESYEGQFQKGDIVEILTPYKEIIGIGMVKYDSEKLNQFLGQKNMPELIHYDYLYIK